MREVDRRERLLGLWLAALLLGIVAPLAPTTREPPPPAALAAEPQPAPVFLHVAARQPRASVLYDAPIEPGLKTVALTFDDGPDPTWTPQVLELLARYRAVATFCVVGDLARAHPALVHRVVDAGMRLCDHSRTHDERLATRLPAQLTDEIVGTQEELGPAEVHYFRAPGGNWSPEMLRIAVGHGMQPLGWSVDSQDWQRSGTPAIVATVEREMHPGAIVLLHDGGGNRSESVAALAELLPWLIAQGYLFTFP